MDRTKFLFCQQNIAPIIINETKTIDFLQCVCHIVPGIKLIGQKSLVHIFQNVVKM